MSIVRVGANKKYCEGWDKAFVGRKRSKKATKGGVAQRKKAKKKK